MSVDWYRQPDGLFYLMYMHTNEQLLEWVRAIMHHQDSLTPGSLQKQAWFLGVPYRTLLSKVADYPWNLYSIYVILIFVSYIPEARERLPPRDIAFLREDVIPRIDWLIRGVMPSGRPITQSIEGLLNLIPTVVHQLIDLYAVGRLSEPDAQQQQQPARAHVPLLDFQL